MTSSVARRRPVMLLPGGQRIVLEVDGTHHYATGPLADPAVYAATIRADRDLKLARYDVFRFAPADLREQKSARLMLRTFVDRRSSMPGSDPVPAGSA